jgi:hypothetical protein
MYDHVSTAQVTNQESKYDWDYRYVRPRVHGLATTSRSEPRNKPTSSTQLTHNLFSSQIETGKQVALVAN